MFYKYKIKAKKKNLFIKFIYFNQFNFQKTFFSSLDFLAFFLDIRREVNSRANTCIIIL